MSLLPKRTPEKALVAACVDEGLYQPVLSADGKPGLTRTPAGEKAGVPQPLSDPNRRG